MENAAEILKHCALFSGISAPELRALLDCLSAAQKKYKKDNFIFMADEAVSLIGIVLSGSVHIAQEDFWGRRTLISRIEPGGIFGEAFSCGEVKKLPVSVFAAESAEILLIDYRKIVTTCSSACVYHTRLIKNMLRILARKNVLLTQKIGIITQRTTREKLLSYLSSEAQSRGSRSFSIPFRRQELADYLSVDRSAMSNELSKMREEGILSFHRNQFELFSPAGPEEGRADGRDPPGGFFPQRSGSSEE